MIMNKIDEAFTLAAADGGEVFKTNIGIGQYFCFQMLTCVKSAAGSIEQQEWSASIQLVILIVTKNLYQDRTAKQLFGATLAADEIRRPASQSTLFAAMKKAAFQTSVIK
jgi:hypothetical protein